MNNPQHDGDILDEAIRAMRKVAPPWNSLDDFASRTARHMQAADDKLARKSRRLRLFAAVLWVALANKSEPEAAPPAVARDLPSPDADKLRPLTEVTLETLSQTLADGSRAVFHEGAQWRNFGRVNRPNERTGELRRVRLVELDAGRAEFEVLKNSDPFIVKTPACTVEVTGTRFEVNVAQMQEKGDAEMTGNKMRSLVTVTVLAGTVAVFNSYGQVNLSAGQQAAVNEGQVPARTGGDSPAVAASQPSEPTTRTSMITATAPAADAIFELKDKADLGVKADSCGACFIPDGKKVLFANKVKEEKTEKDAIVYTLIGADGKGKKEVYRFRPGNYAIQFQYWSFGRVFPGRGGNISPDGSSFTTCPDVDDLKGTSETPVVTCDMDGKTLPVYEPDRKKVVTFNGLIINGVFGKEGKVYYSGTNSIMCHAPATKQDKTLVEFEGNVSGAIVISPDRARLAGSVVNMETVNNEQVWRKKYWIYDIPSGQISYSLPLAEMGKPVAAIVWSQDNATIFISIKSPGVPNGIYSFSPFITAQKTADDEAKKLRTLAVQLGDDDSGRRESAMIELRTAGAKAAEFLDEAAKSDDAEVARRAKLLLGELKGKVALVLERKNIENFLEVAPGYLYVHVKDGDSQSALLVDAAACKTKPLNIESGLVLVDRVGDLGLFRNFKDGCLWTAGIILRPDSPPASASASPQLELKDKTDLGVKVETCAALRFAPAGNACFTPNGKNILMASFRPPDDRNEKAADDRKKQLIYSLVSLDGREKQAIYKVDVEEFFSGGPVSIPIKYFSPFPDNRGNISPDGRIFNVPLANTGQPVNPGGTLFYPFALGAMDGKEIKLPAGDDADIVWVPNASHHVFKEMGNIVRFEGVFDGDGLLYYTKLESGFKSIDLFQFDPRKGTVQKLSKISVYPAAAPLAISPDRAKIAGFGHPPKSVDYQIWIYDIKSGRMAISPIMKKSKVIITGQCIRIAWSQDGTTVYFSDIFGYLYAYKPEEPKVPTAAETAEYKELVAKLAGEDSNQREEAAAKLSKAGAKAFDVLKEAAGSKDPEITQRARKILSEPLPDGKVSPIIEHKINMKRVVSDFIEIAPGYIYVYSAMSGDDGVASIFNVSTGQWGELAGNLILIDKLGDMGLFRDAKYNLWTAKIKFTTPATQPAMLQPASQPASGPSGR